MFGSAASRRLDSGEPLWRGGADNPCRMAVGARHQTAVISCSTKSFNLRLTLIGNGCLSEKTPLALNIAELDSRGMATPGRLPNVENRTRVSARQISKLGPRSGRN